MRSTIVEWANLITLYDRVAQICGKHARPDGTDSIADQLITAAEALDVIEGEALIDPYSDGFRPGFVEDLIRVRLFLRALADAASRAGDSED